MVREGCALEFADKYLLPGFEEITADFPGETKLMLDTRKVRELKRSLPVVEEKRKLLSQLEF